MPSEETGPGGESLMNSGILRILFVSDIVGAAGLDMLRSQIGFLREKYPYDLFIANGENAAEGKGLSSKMAEDLFAMGVDVITSGNHIWNRDNIFKLMEREFPVLRPLNYPEGCPGKGSCIARCGDGTEVGVINLQGRSFMYPIDCPFACLERELQSMKARGVRSVLVDFHAEATAEKKAFGFFADGRVSAVIGTHTHVQTADEQVLPNGTAYITDAGMTGPQHSVIGLDVDTAIERFRTQIPVHYKIAHGNCQLDGVAIGIRTETGKTDFIKRIHIEQR
jgi:metallophosphoesterase (TIGR00282 family)